MELEITVNQPLSFYRLAEERIDNDPSKRTVEIVFRVFCQEREKLVKELRGVVPRVIGQRLPKDELAGVQAAVLSHDRTGVIAEKANGERATYILPTPRSYSEDARWCVETSEEEFGVAYFELFYKLKSAVIEAKTGRVLLKTRGIESRCPLSKGLMTVSGVRAVHIPPKGRFIGLTIWQAGTIWLELPTSLSYARAADAFRWPTCTQSVSDLGTCSS